MNKQQEFEANFLSLDEMLDNKQLEDGCSIDNGWNDKISLAYIYIWMVSNED